jgi:putative copper export protein
VSSTGRTVDPAGASGPPRSAAPGRATAIIGLVALATLIPLLGPSAALHGTGEAAAPDATGVALLRTVLLLALCVPVGELFTVRLARRVSGAPLDRLPRSRAPLAAVAGCVAALGLAFVAAGGTLLPHSLTGPAPDGLFGSRDGALALLEADAFGAAWLCTAAGLPSLQVWPSAAVVVAEALRAHPATEHLALVGSGLTFIHLTCTALWVGGLLHVLRTLHRWRAPQEGAALLARYARVAAVLLAGITATGVCSTLRRMPPGGILDQLTTTAYGRALLAKLLLVAVVAGLALCARLRMGRAGDPLSAGVPARAEVVVLGAVVAVSALLTALPLPAGG